MKNLAILVNSCDAVSDLWLPFCDFFRKYWPEYTGKIYFITEEKSFQYEDLNIINLQLGKCHFGKRVRLACEQVEEKYIMLMLEDYFILGNVDNKAIEDYFNLFRNLNLDTLCFSNGKENVISLNNRNAYLKIPPSKYSFSCQVAFWKKDVFVSNLRDYEDPWETEIFGSCRFNYYHPQIAVADKSVIPFLASGVLRQGKWVKEAVKIIREQKYEIDYNIRGFFVPKQKKDSFFIRLFKGNIKLHLKQRIEILRLFLSNRKQYLSF